MLTDPRHDGSPLYVDDAIPTLRAVGLLSCRTDGEVDDVWIRTTEDAEPTFHASTVTNDGEHVLW